VLWSRSPIRNSSDTPLSSVQIHYTLNDGNSAAHRLWWCAEPVPGDIMVAITAHNDAPVFVGLDNPAPSPRTAPRLSSTATHGERSRAGAPQLSGATLTLARKWRRECQRRCSAPAVAGVVLGRQCDGRCDRRRHVHHTGGTLAITFNGNATGTFVNNVAQQITYSNTNDDSAPRRFRSTIRSMTARRGAGHRRRGAR